MLPLLMLLTVIVFFLRCFAGGWLADMPYADAAMRMRGCCRCRAPFSPLICYATPPLLPRRHACCLPLCCRRHIAAYDARRVFFDAAALRYRYLPPLLMLRHAAAAAADAYAAAATLDADYAAMMFRSFMRYATFS